MPLADADDSYFESSRGLAEIDVAGYGFSTDPLLWKLRSYICGVILHAVGTAQSGDFMNTKVAELMSESVVTAEPHQSVEHVRQILDRNRISSLPVVDSEGQPVGVVSATDLAHDLKAGSPISKIMTEKVYVVPKYEDVSIAARIMRNHKIHHVVVTHEKKVVGILSAFDLLKLVEGHRYVAKNAPTKSKRKGSKRR